MTISYFQPIFVANFVTIAMVKVKFIPNFYPKAIVLIKQKEEIGEKTLFWTHRGWRGAN